MKKKTISSIIVILILLAVGDKQELLSLLFSTNDSVSETSTPFQNSQNTSDSSFNSLFQNQQNDIQVQGEARVFRILSDDNDGSRHQRIIVELDSGQTLLIAHNIDLAPRINSISKNDTIAFYGVYEWSSQGGVIHWTHIDPSNRHIDGWLIHNGRTYE